MISYVTRKEDNEGKATFDHVAIVGVIEMGEGNFVLCTLISPLRTYVPQERSLEELMFERNFVLSGPKIPTLISLLFSRIFHSFKFTRAKSIPKFIRYLPPFQVYHFRQSNLFYENLDEKFGVAYRNSEWRLFPTPSLAPSSLHSLPFPSPFRPVVQFLRRGKEEGTRVSVISISLPVPTPHPTPDITRKTTGTNFLLPPALNNSRGKKSGLLSTIYDLFFGNQNYPTSFSSLPSISPVPLHSRDTKYKHQAEARESEEHEPEEEEEMTTVEREEMDKEVKGMIEEAVDMEMRKHGVEGRWRCVLPVFTCLHLSHEEATNCTLGNLSARKLRFQFCVPEIGSYSCNTSESCEDSKFPSSPTMHDLLFLYTIVKKGRESEEMRREKDENSPIFNPHFDPSKAGRKKSEYKIYILQLITPHVEGDDSRGEKCRKERNDSLSLIPHFYFF